MNDIPQDFAEALKEGGVEEFFLKYPPSHKREHLRVINDAKKPETRKERIGKAVKMISGKQAAASARLKK